MQFSYAVNPKAPLWAKLRWLAGLPEDIRQLLKTKQEEEKKAEERKREK
jgi:hypothetical protein